MHKTLPRAKNPPRYDVPRRARASRQPQVPAPRPGMTAAPSAGTWHLPACRRLETPSVSHADQSWIAASIVSPQTVAPLPGASRARRTLPGGRDMSGRQAASSILDEVCRSRTELVRTRRAKSRARLLSGMTSFPAGRAARSAGRKAGRRRVMSRAPGTNRAAPRERNAAHEGKGPGQWLRSSA